MDRGKSQLHIRVMAAFVGFLAANCWVDLRAEDLLPPGWTTAAAREEIKPQFSFDRQGGRRGEGALRIAASDSIADQGWFQKSFPVKGGQFYRFTAQRQTQDVQTPRRSTIVRLVWQDAAGKPVRADVPSGREGESGSIPLAEPEHPLDQSTDVEGWTEVAGVYRAPSKAAQAVVELHLQWAPNGHVAWSGVRFEETSPPASRKVRLAAVHYRPKGKSVRTNCEEFAPLIDDAAKQQADLIVLGETVTYVGVSKKPHEVAEPIPGPSSEYFGQLAAQHRTHIVVSLYERDGKAVYNAAVLMGPDGSLLGKYRKVCLPHSEVEAGVTPGDEYPVFNTKLGKIGLMVCYDGFFPEVARELTNRGAEIIAWPVWGCNPLLAQARACENHVYVVSSTYTDAKTNWMLSAVYDHAGKAIAQCDKWGSVAVAEVDLSQTYFWRNNLGDFRSMVQRHRPPVTSALAHARADAPLRVCLLSGCNTYDSESSLPPFQSWLEQNYNVRCTRVVRKATDDLPGLDQLDNCDVAFVFIKRMQLKDDQLAQFQKYVTSGKPIVAVRTASHAVQTWLEFDKEVLGGNYQGHHAVGPVTQVETVKRHPILEGVELTTVSDSLYKNSGHGSDIQVLLQGAIPGQPSEPLAWTRQYKGGRVFYTSLGSQETFEKPAFRRLLANALFWAAGRALEAKKSATGN